MAQDDGQERTEEATPKKREKARGEGQIPRSRELTTFIMLMASAVGLMMFGAQIAEGLMDLLSNNMYIPREDIYDAKRMLPRFFGAITDAIWLLIPLMLLLIVAALLTPMPMGGYVFSSKLIKFTLSKLNPIKGIKRIFSVQGLMELVKSIIKVALIIPVGVFLYLWEMDSFMGLGYEPFKQAMAHAGELFVWAIFILSLTLVVIAAVDMPYQKYQYSKNLKMTKQEVKDERKNSDGDPMVKGRIRSKQREIALRRMMAEVPKADVIITNPTHYAVAIKYDQQSNRAPLLLAKGVDILAMQIRSMGLSYDVPIIRAPSLARAIYYSTELNQEIPEGLYLATAQVLAYIYRLKEESGGRQVRPDNMNDLPIPEDLRRDE